MIDDRYKYKSTVLARYIIAYANEHNYGINMTKLQKLLYITYGVYLAVKGERLTDEHPQAWPYGPVFPTTRNRLLKIPFDVISLHNEEQDITDDVKSCVKLVFDTYGNFNAGTLSVWSHQSGSPWELTTKREGFKWGDRILDEDIKEYFASMIKKK